MRSRDTARVGYLEDQLEDVVRNEVAAAAGLLDQVEGLGELEGLVLVAVDLKHGGEVVVSTGAFLFSGQLQQRRNIVRPLLLPPPRSLVGPFIGASLFVPLCGLGTGR